jgi:hypothetical protein
MYCRLKGENNMLKILSNSTSGLGDSYKLALEIKENEVTAKVYDLSDQYLGQFTKLANKPSIINIVALNRSVFSVVEYFRNKSLANLI